MTPAGFGVFTAFFIGLLADVLQGKIFGGNAMALSLIAYISYRFHLEIRVFHMWQMMLSVLLMLLLVFRKQLKRQAFSFVDSSFDDDVGIFPDIVVCFLGLC